MYRSDDSDENDDAKGDFGLEESRGALSTQTPQPVDPISTPRPDLAEGDDGVRTATRWAFVVGVFPPPRPRTKQIVK